VCMQQQRLPGVVVVVVVVGGSFVHARVIRVVRAIVVSPFVAVMVVLRAAFVDAPRTNLRASCCSLGQSLLNFKMEAGGVQLFEGVDYSFEAKKARDKELLRAKRMELIQDVSWHPGGGGVSPVPHPACPPAYLHPCLRVSSVAHDLLSRVLLLPCLRCGWSCR
jgi:hypothetical protein